MFQSPALVVVVIVVVSSAGILFSPRRRPSSIIVVIVDDDDVDHAVIVDSPRGTNVPAESNPNRRVAHTTVAHQSSTFLCVFAQGVPIIILLSSAFSRLSHEPEPQVRCFVTPIMILYRWVSHIAGLCLTKVRINCGWTFSTVETEQQHDDESCNSHPSISIAFSRCIRRGIRHRRSGRLLPPSHVSEGGIVVVVVDVVVVVVVVTPPRRRVVLHVRTDAGRDRRFCHAADDDPGEGSEKEFGFLLQRAWIQVDTLFGGTMYSKYTHHNIHPNHETVSLQVNIIDYYINLTP